MCLVCAVVPRICLGSWKDPVGMDDLYIGRRKMSVELSVPFKALYDTATLRCSCNQRSWFPWVRSVQGLEATVGIRLTSCLLLLLN